MTAHTPGPWHVGTAHNPPSVYARDGLDIICTCDSMGEEPRASELANARLIAQAPAMAKALRAALVLLERLAPDTGRKLLNGSECSIGHYASYHVDVIRSILSSIEGK